MEEIITLDGKQFKLTTDVPLTAEQKAQTLAEIRKQTGCGTCGQPRTAKMGNDWQYGGVKSLTATCINPANPGGSATNPKNATDIVTMTVTPTQGVAPYSLFFRKTLANTYVEGDAGATEPIPRASLATPVGHPDPRVLGTSGANTWTGIFENDAIWREYTITTVDINGATTKGTDTGPTIWFASTLTDSCATPQTCTNACKVYVGCALPLCDFTVT